MQIRFAAFIAVVMYLWNTVEAAKIDALCRKWECQVGVGGDKTKTDRLCSVANATQTDGTIGVEACQPTEYLCNAPVTFATNTSCSTLSVLPWKSGIASGDSCTSDAECASGSCQTTGSSKTCVGKNETQDCKVDNECNAGLFCNNLKCANVTKEGKACDATTKCEFGTYCMNKNCTRFGTQAVGTQFSITGVTTGAKGDIVNMVYSRLCSSFWAEITGNVTADTDKFTLFECTNGRTLTGGKYSRGVGDDDTCAYTYSYKDGTTGAGSEVAACGYNTDGMKYCGKRRDASEYKDLNSNDKATWGSYKDLGCHYNSTIQYCRKIEDNAVISLGFRSAMKNEFDSNGAYPFIAKCDRCVGDAIVNTKNYFRVVDLAYGTMLSYFALVVGFFSIALLY